MGKGKGNPESQFLSAMRGAPVKGGISFNNSIQRLETIAPFILPLSKFGSTKKSPLPCSPRTFECCSWHCNLNRKGFVIFGVDIKTSDVVSRRIQFIEPDTSGTQLSCPEDYCLPYIQLKKNDQREWLILVCGSY